MSYFENNASISNDSAAEKCPEGYEIVTADDRTIQLDYDQRLLMTLDRSLSGYVTERGRYHGGHNLLKVETCTLRLNCKQPLCVLMNVLHGKRFLALTQNASV